MMSGVVNEGTATSARIDRPVAGKTGTTDKAKDIWFIGYIPQLVAGVWSGNDNNTPTGNASSTAAYTWSRFMREAVKGMPVEQFPGLPKNVDKRKPELKLKPVRPRYQKTLSAPPRDGSTSDNDNVTPRRRSRARNNEINQNSTSRQSRVRDNASANQAPTGNRSRRNRDN
jgi:penicillin-binding protein 1A